MFEDTKISRFVGLVIPFFRRKEAKTLINADLLRMPFDPGYSNSPVPFGNEGLVEVKPKIPI